MITKKTDFLRLEIWGRGGTLVTYGDRSPAHVHRSPLLDVRHLSDAGDRIQAGGKGVAGEVAWMFRVDVTLQHPDVPLLDALDPATVRDRAEVDGEEDDVGEQGRDDLVSDLEERQNAVWITSFSLLYVPVLN